MIKMKDFGKEVTTIDFSPKYDLIVLGTSTGEIICIDYEMNTLDEIEASSKKINIARFNENGRTVAIGGSDGTVRIMQISKSLIG
jgi:WD40 repeat protein